MLGELTVGHLGTEVKFVKQCQAIPKSTSPTKEALLTLGAKISRQTWLSIQKKKKETVGKTGHCATANIKKPPLQCLLQGMILFSFLPG